MDYQLVLSPSARADLRLSDVIACRIVKLNLFPKARYQYTSAMASITEVEKLALDLPENQRALLAAHLLGSLAAVLHDEDEGIAEALLRDAELDANPTLGVSLEQLDRQFNKRRS